MSFLWRTWQWLTGTGDAQGAAEAPAAPEEAAPAAPHRPSPEEVRRLRLQKLEAERQQNPATTETAASSSQLPEKQPQPEPKTPPTPEPAPPEQTYSKELCLCDVEMLAVEECLRVRVGDLHWKRPLSLGVPDAGLTDLRSAGVDFCPAGITKASAEALVAALLAVPCEDVVAYFVESHTRLCEELRATRLLRLWTLRRSVRAQGLAPEPLAAPYTAALATLRDMVKKRPKTKEEFRRVSGVGEVKAARYGKDFLRIIAKFE